MRISQAQLSHFEGIAEQTYRSSLPGHIADYFPTVSDVCGPVGVERVIDLVETAGMESDVVIMSLNDKGIQKVKSLRPSWTVGLLTIDPANPRGVALFDALVRRTFTAVDDLDAGRALGFDAGG